MDTSAPEEKDLKPSIAGLTLDRQHAGLPPADHTNGIPSSAERKDSSALSLQDKQFNDSRLYVSRHNVVGDAKPVDSTAPMLARDVRKIQRLKRMQWARRNDFPLHACEAHPPLHHENPMAQCCPPSPEATRAHPAYVKEEPCDDELDTNPWYGGYSELEPDAPAEEDRIRLMDSRIDIAGWEGTHRQQLPPDSPMNIEGWEGTHRQQVPPTSQTPRSTFSSDSSNDTPCCVCRANRLRAEGMDDNSALGIDHFPSPVPGANFRTCRAHCEACWHDRSRRLQLTHDQEVVHTHDEAIGFAAQALVQLAQPGRPVRHSGSSGSSFKERRALLFRHIYPRADPRREVNADQVHADLIRRSDGKVLGRVLKIPRALRRHRAAPPQSDQQPLLRQPTLQQHDETLAALEGRTAPQQKQLPDFLSKPRQSEKGLTREEMTKFRAHFRAQEDPKEEKENTETVSVARQGRWMDHLTALPSRKWTEPNADSWNRI